MLPLEDSRRFSEDFDIVLDRHALGCTGETALKKVGKRAAALMEES